jgi:hypothetical protein
VEVERVPVWFHDGFTCTGEVYKNDVKITFPEDASLERTLQASSTSASSLST